MGNCKEKSQCLSDVHEAIRHGNSLVSKCFHAVREIRKCSRTNTHHASACREKQLHKIHHMEFSMKQLSFEELHKQYGTVLSILWRARRTYHHPDHGGSFRSCVVHCRPALPHR